MSDRMRPSEKAAPLAFAALLAIGAVGCAAGWWLAPRRFFFAWLVAFAFAFSIAVGALVLLAIAHAVRARWLVAIRRIIEWPVAALPIFPLLLLPILLGANELYAWADPSPDLPAAALRAIEHRGAWASLPFFALRSLAWVGVPAFFAFRLVRAAQRQDVDPRAERKEQMRRDAAIAIPLVGLAITFGAFDWLMSLQPGWISTIFGIYFFSGGFVAGLALIAVLLPRLWRTGALEAQALENHRIALGKLLLAMTIFWAYVAFAQLLLVWIADLPREIDFYARRTAGGWKLATYALAVAHFALPFVLLLSRELKRSRSGLVLVGGLLLLAHALDVHWLVVPVLEPKGPALHLVDAAAFAAVVGAAGLAAIASWRGRPSIAVGDPDFAAALRYRGS